ncbi:hypothetical protein ACEQ8H_008948 [Pleosporales sp. CAS-2024a]
MSDFIVYTNKPPGRDQKPKPKTREGCVDWFLDAPVPPVKACFSTWRETILSRSEAKTITRFALAVESSLHAGHPKGEWQQRIELFMFLSYVAVLEIKAKRSRDDNSIATLEKAMKTALHTFDTNGAEKDMPLDYLKQIRSGVLLLHRVIDSLVANSWPPARATFAVTSRAFSRSWRYSQMKAKLIEPMVAGLLRSHAVDDADGCGPIICIASELAWLDPLLDATHKDLGYKFECPTCSPPSAPSGNIATPVRREQEVGHADAKTEPAIAQPSLSWSAIDDQAPERAPRPRNNEDLRIEALLNDSDLVVNDTPRTRLGEFESPRSDRCR